jgi:hypothetical protein
MKKLCFFLVLLALLASLTACQLIPQQAASSGPAPALITTATPIPLPAATALPTVLPTAVSNLAPTAAPTADNTLQLAEKAVQDYFDALSKGDASAAAKLLSTFSLAHASMTRGDAADELKAEMALGTQWSDLKIQGSQHFDATTILVHVAYTRTDADAKTGKSTSTSVDEQWPVRLEAGQWRYNRGNLIDFHTVDVPERTLSGLTVKPREIDRYSDHLSLILLVQNATGDAIAMGTSNTVLATFHFGEQKVDAVQKVIVIDRLRSYPAVSIEASGQFAAYPDSVDLIQYIHYSGGPWFTFQLGS